MTPWWRLATEEFIKEQFNGVNINKVEVHHGSLGYQMTEEEQK
jgi:hypothetical protein